MFMKRPWKNFNKQILEATDMRSVNEVSKLSGVSRRTLQYYDEIGLLPPTAVKESGYRQYDDESLLRLWRILFYKELGFSLNDVRLLLSSPKETEKALMRKHKQNLLEKQAQLQKMMVSIDGILDDKFDISMLKDFDKTKIEEAKKRYAKEMSERIENSDNEFYDFYHPLVQYKMRNGKVFNIASVVSKMPDVAETDWDKLKKQGETVMNMFRNAIKDGPESAEARNAVAAFRKFASAFISCKDHELLVIGQSYLDEKKAVNKKIPGLAEFISMAIQCAVGQA
jgi:DNA-binding transcriptional MerR regulator